MRECDLPPDESKRMPRPVVIGALFVVLAVALNASLAFAPSGRYPSLDLVALRSERVELVRVVSPLDTSHLPLFTSGRIVHYQVVRRLLGRGPSADSVTVHVLAPQFLPLENDTLVMFWELLNRTDFEDGTRYLTAVNLTDPERSDGWPALTSDCRIPHDRDSVLAILVLRAAMVRAECPLGDERRLSLADFVEGRGCVERWMLDSCEAAEVNPMSMNMLASPADGKMLPACRTKVARHLAAMRAEGIPALSRAVALALKGLEARSRH